VERGGAKPGALAQSAHWLTRWHAGLLQHPRVLRREDGLAAAVGHDGEEIDSHRIVWDAAF